MIEIANYIFANIEFLKKVHTKVSSDELRYFWNKQIMVTGQVSTLIWLKKSIKKKLRMGDYS